MDLTNQAEREVEWEELRSPKVDRHQTWVAVLGFFLLFLGLPISSFFSRISIFPLLLGINFMAYGGLTGNTWYREEMVPYLDRTVGVSDSERLAYLKHRRYSKDAILIAGFLSAIPCDIIFAFFWNEWSPLTLVDPIYALAFMFLVPIILGIMIFQIYLWMVLFRRRLSSTYPDIQHLIVHEQTWMKRYKAFKKGKEIISQ